MRVETVFFLTGVTLGAVGVLGVEGAFSPNVETDEEGKVTLYETNDFRLEPALTDGIVVEINDKPYDEPRNEIAKEVARLLNENNCRVASEQTLPPREVIFQGQSSSNPRSLLTVDNSAACLSNIADS